MYLADYHVHSTCSQDGRQTMAQAAQAAVAAGMDELCLTDHVDTIYWGPEQKPRWDFDWDAVRRQFRQAQEQWGHRITLRLGAELGEAAMSFQRAEHLMQNAPPLDFVIGSVHMAGKKFHHKDLYYIEKADEAYYDSIIDSYLEDVLELASLKLMLQPMVENAIYHGMEYADGEGEIHIRAFREGERVIIEVEDNGPGMSEEVVEQLLTPGRERSAAKAKGSGIGFRNVHQRIRLTFGGEYGLTIHSEPDNGTLVRICLPALTEDDARKYRKEGEQ